MRCVRCQKEKDKAEFNWKDKQRGKRHSTCRECQKLVRRAWYERNRDHAIAYSVESSRRIRDRNCRFIFEYLRESSCEDCGEDDFIVLEFDHRFGDKVDSVTKMALNGVSLKRLEAEIEKCEVRCANCHRRRTANAHNWFRVLFGKEEDGDAPVV